MEGIINIYGVIGEMPNEKGEIIKPCVTFLDVARQVETQKEASFFSAVINSPGGYVEDGDEMCNYMEGIKKDGRPINTYAEGTCASAAVKLFLIGNKREVHPDIEFMIHNPGGAPVHGDADYIESYYKELRAMESDMINHYHERTGTSKEVLKTLMKKETFLTAEQAVEFGFATGIKEKVELKAVAFSKKFNQNQVKMSKQQMTKEEVESNMDTILSKIAAFFTKDEKPKAKLVQDANGTEIDFPDLAEDDAPSVGDKATIDGSAAEGEHLMPNGETFVFAAGELLEIKPEEEENEEVEALKKENQTLKDQLNAEAKKATDAQKEVTALKGKLTSNETGLKEIQKEIKALKKDIGSNFTHDPKKKNFREEGKTRSVWKDKE